MKKNEPMQINWNSTSTYKPVVWDLVYSRSMKLREEGNEMFEPNKTEYLNAFLQEKADDLKKGNEQLRIVNKLCETRIAMLEAEKELDKGYREYLEKRIREADTYCKEWFEKYKALKGEKE